MMQKRAAPSPVRARRSFHVAGACQMCMSPRTDAAKIAGIRKGFCGREKIPGEMVFEKQAREKAQGACQEGAQMPLTMISGKAAAGGGKYPNPIKKCINQQVTAWNRTL